MIHLLIIAILNSSVILASNKQSEKPLLTLIKREYQIPYGQTVKVEVELTRGTEPIDYKWEFDSGDLPSGMKSDGLILFTDNFKESMKGIYSLRAQNKYGKRFELEVKKIGGTEPLLYKWSFDDKDIPKGIDAKDLNLKIDKFEAAFGGIYTLHATNAFGWYKLYIRLDVQK
ncbi:hypothetical protein SNEBB_001572 [Seison nebaliae]|nr:hypothetical protein SNEBB_001572 [Seison nebaliae]